MFRLLPIETVGEQIFDGYEMEEEEFECTTEQPACRQQCFNRFHPISHSRLWELQILIVSVPILIFSGVALTIADENKSLQRKVKKYESSSMIQDDQKTREYHLAKHQLTQYTITKVIILESMCMSYLKF